MWNRSMMTRESMSQADEVEEIDVVSVEEVEANPIDITSSVSGGENISEGSKNSPTDRLYTIKAMPVKIKKVKLKRIQLRKLRMPNTSKGYTYGLSPSPPHNSPIRIQSTIGDYATTLILTTSK